ncbi:MAG: T9SS type A sorting domain-containing protein [Bacteroidetes bacterium]|nr:T9SS type A sorting domain-containing protein [Bacteroidota bacterium]MBL0278775.1 T9SS type A sorting domain-containing protein [Bacteroidota bacterium]MBP8894383.1 T9SS type A sorting domain-containing protein [Saprospiraceae bacterium]MBP9880083.1 T9SS type A sorting domain-containing protein [Chitinophagales bacterium]
MKISLLVTIFLCNLRLTAQIPSLVWNMSYGGTEFESGHSVIIQGNDFVLVGDSNSADGDVDFNAGYDDIYLAKINSSNELLFSKTYGGSDIEHGYSISETFDGGLLVGGASKSNDGDIPNNYGFNDAILLKTDSSGNLEWIRNYGGSQEDIISSIITTLDSGYIFTGTSKSTDIDITDHLGVSENSDIIVGRTDSVGNLLWLRSYGTVFSDGANEIIKTKDSCYLICGYVNFFFADYYVLKIDAAGNILWEQIYGGTEFDQAYSIYELTDGNLIVCGETNSNDGDVSFSHGSTDNWVICLDPDGILIWQRSYGGSKADIGFEVFESLDNSIFISGSTTTDNDGDIVGHHGATLNGDFWTLKIDYFGVIKWTNCYGGISPEWGYGSTELIDSTYVIIGSSFSSDGDVDGHHEEVVANTDIWAIKLKETCIQEKYYEDLDNDLYGNQNIYIYSCFDTLGFVIATLEFDCDDTNPAIYPDAVESCNYIDDNCNGLFDEGFAYLHTFEDFDGDGFGNENVDSLSCIMPAGFVLDNTDCDDSNNTIYPGGTELLNGLDDDCDQIADEGLATTDIVKNTISIFPNPVNSILFIQSDATQHITIVNQLGEEILHTDLFIGLNTISVADFASGVYWVKAENGEMVVWVKE